MGFRALVGRWDAACTPRHKALSGRPQARTSCDARLAWLFKSKTPPALSDGV
jgi:hypothetical protein